MASPGTTEVDPRTRLMCLNKVTTESESLVRIMHLCLLLSRAPSAKFALPQALSDAHAAAKTRLIAG
jgi:hypothetical protein